MPRGRTTSLRVILTTQERLTLDAWLRATTLPVGQARRARLILLVAEGLPLTQVADRVGISRRFVYTWVRRYLTQGLDGLKDRPRRGTAPRCLTWEETP